MKNALRYHFVKSLALVAGAALLSVSAVHAQDSGALIDALVKKGVLSDQEAEDIRVDLTKEYNTTSAGKIEISSFINHLKLFGDARLRYVWQNQQTYAASGGAGPAGGAINNNDLSQYRFRLRLGAEYTYDPHWSAVVRLETATGNDSTNTNFGDYFDKTANPVYVGQVYLRYQDKFSLFDGTHTVADGKNFKTISDPGLEVGLDVLVGRAPAQIVINEAFWDDDLNPDGLAEQLTFNNVGVDGLSFAARGAQYITSDNSTGGLVGTAQTDGAVTPSTTNTSSKNESAFLFIVQGEAKYEWAPKSNVIISPLFLTETPGTFTTTGAIGSQGGNTYSAGALGSGSNTAILGGLNDVIVPLEVNFKLFGVPNKVFGTYGVNLTAADRLNRETGFPGSSRFNVAQYAGLKGQDTFWNAGYQIGELKKKGDWQASADYRYIAALSYTDNLSDSDWADGLINQQGVAIKASYLFTDFLRGGLVYYHSNPIEAAGPNGTLNGGGINELPGTGAGQVDIVQAELNWKF